MTINILNYLFNKNEVKKFAFYIFRRKYPLLIQEIRPIILTGISVSYILLFFEPFGFQNFNGNKFIGAVGFALATIFCLIISNYVIKKIFIQKYVERWTIILEIIYTLIVIVSISIINYCYLHFIVNGVLFTAVIFFKILYSTLFIGVFPTTIMVIIKYNYYLRTDMSVLIDHEKKTITAKKITLRSSCLPNSKIINLEIDALLFIESVKNNILIYYYDKECIKTESIRNTLTNIDKQLNGTNMFRCHRSFLINLNKIEKMKGNSNGYKIYLKNYNKTIPVSRSYTKLFIQLLE